MSAISGSISSSSGVSPPTLAPDTIPFGSATTTAPPTLNIPTAKRPPRKRKIAPNLHPSHHPELTALATQIKEQSALCVRSSLDHARQAGEALIEAKAKCHAVGEKFMWFVESACDLSQRTANLYMRIADNWEKIKDQPHRTFNEIADTLAERKRQPAQPQKKTDTPPKNETTPQPHAVIGELVSGTEPPAPAPKPPPQPDTTEIYDLLDSLEGGLLHLLDFTADEIPEGERDKVRQKVAHFQDWLTDFLQGFPQ